MRIRKSLIVAAVLAFPLSLLGVLPASAATQTVTNWSDLQSAFSSAAIGQTTTIVLANDISTTTSATSFLTVNTSASTTGAAIVLDLNGHHLTVPANTDGSYPPAIGVYKGSSLTIQDSVGGGVLNATAGNYAAAIGIGYGVAAIKTSPADRTGGTIIINSGTVNATGGDRSSGIGGGYFFGGGVIEINGGQVTATGGGMAPGIGNGWGQGSATGTNDATSIRLAGGVVTAVGNGGSPGIGRGLMTASTVAAGSISISGCGSVSATGGSGAANSFGGGAGIGAGAVASGTTVAPDPLSIDGAPQAGAPTVAASGAAGTTAAGVGSPITYSGKASYQLTVTATTPSTAADGGIFTVLCTAVSPSTPSAAPSAPGLPATGVNAPLGVAGVAALLGAGAVLLMLTRRRLERD